MKFVIEQTTVKDGDYHYQVIGRYHTLEEGLAALDKCGPGRFELWYTEPPDFKGGGPELMARKGQPISIKE